MKEDDAKQIALYGFESCSDPDPNYDPNYNSDNEQKTNGKSVT